MRGCFVTGTDTAAGKTILAAAITAALRAGGVDAIGLKPVLTGLDEPPDPQWPHDHVLLARASESSPDLVNAVGFGPAVSPHLAAELAGTPLRADELRGAVVRAAAEHQVVVVEGVGGLLVPFSEDYDVRAFARDLDLPVVIAARPGLGTINHTLLTLEAARSVGLRVAAVVLTPWPAVPDRVQRSNRRTIERLGEAPVFTLPHLPAPDPELLARAARGLPLDRWLAAPPPRGR